MHASCLIEGIGSGPGGGGRLADGVRPDRDGPAGVRSHTADEAATLLRPAAPREPGARGHATCPPEGMDIAPARLVAPPPASRLAGHLLGAGLGGFVDGIVLHQVAQWHNMGSAVLPPVTMAAMSRNMTWDGLFHAATWCVVVAGIFALAADARRGRRIPGPLTLSGQLVAGWGLFNLVEGIVDHHLLQLHHVRDMPVHVPALDWWFLALGGVGLLLLGRVLELTGARRDLALPALRPPRA